jgi:hypothetical protein
LINFLKKLGEVRKNRLRRRSRLPTPFFLLISKKRGLVGTKSKFRKSLHECAHVDVCNTRRARTHMQPSLSCATSRSEVPTLLTSRSHRPTSSIHDQFLSIPVDRTVPILMLSRCQIGARQGTRSDPRSGILRIPKFAFFRVLEVSLEKSQFFTPRVDPEFEHFLRSNSVTPRGAGGARIRPPTRGGEFEVPTELGWSLPGSTPTGADPPPWNRVV